MSSKNSSNAKKLSEKVNRSSFHYVTAEDRAVDRVAVVGADEGNPTMTPRIENMITGKREFVNLHTIEVNGLDHGSHGRSCTAHDVCGYTVRISDKLYCEWGVQEINNRPPEDVVFVRRIIPFGEGKGLASCHVGYIPRRYFCKYQPLWFEGMYE